MAGHSHSANIKYRKDRVDAARAKAFSKLARMITVAAKLGGGEPESNPRLRLAIDKARMVSMPKDNIARAIKKGVGGGDEGNYEEALYEGYAPHGVALMIETLTDNRNRTVPALRHVFDRAHGKLAANGSVSYMFELKGRLPLAAEQELDEEKLLEVVLEVGAEDLVQVGDGFEVRCEPGDFETVRDGLEAAGVQLEGGEKTYIPTQLAQITAVSDARSVLRCIDALEDLDDVQSVHANFDFSDEVLEGLANES